MKRKSPHNGNEIGYDDVSDDPELEKYLLDVKAGRIKPKIVGTNLDLRKLLRKREDERVIRKVERIDREMDEGKRKGVPLGEVLRKMRARKK